MLPSKLRNLLRLAEVGLLQGSKYLFKLFMQVFVVFISNSQEYPDPLSPFTIFRLENLFDKKICDV